MGSGFVRVMVVRMKRWFLEAADLAMILAAGVYTGVVLLADKVMRR